MTTKKPKRNLVLISLDDVFAFWKYKAAFGEILQTPNLDRICAQSTAFHSAYTQVPVCSPSRASFMSGKSPHHTGITTPDKTYLKEFPAETLWPYVLKQDGYFCSSGGKMVQGYGPLSKEIQDTLYSDHRKTFSLGRRPRKYDNGLVADDINRMEFGGFRGGLATVDEADDSMHYDYQAAQSAISFLKSHKGDQPFYREVGFCAAHGPWTTPMRFKEMYSETKIRKPAAWKSGFDESPFMESFFPANIDNSQLRFWKKSVRNYFSSMSHVDYYLGQVWDAIKASRHADNTLIVILSDHGLHLGERNRFRKHTLWEQVANVPLIIHDPARPVAQVVTDPVGLIDVAPTVMDYLDLPPIVGSVGRSLRPQMDWYSAPDRAIPTFLGDSAAIRKGKYRFIRYADGSTQFYDLSKDWWQAHDLGSKHPDFAEMSAAHATCCMEYGLDTGALAVA